MGQRTVGRPHPRTGRQLEAKASRGRRTRQQRHGPQTGQWPGGDPGPPGAEPSAGLSEAVRPTATRRLSPALYVPSRARLRRAASWTASGSGRSRPSRPPRRRGRWPSSSTPTTRSTGLRTTPQVRAFDGGPARRAPGGARWATSPRLTADDRASASGSVGRGRQLGDGVATWRRVLIVGGTPWGGAHHGSSTSRA